MNKKQIRAELITLLKEELLDIFQADDLGDGRWITTESGQKVFIREGESISDAFARQRQYSEAHPKIHQKEKIVVTKSIDKEHIKSAQQVHKNYPNLSESFLREQAKKADEIRAAQKPVAEKIVSDFKKKFPDAEEVSGRLKDRTNMLDKLGRKPETYKDVAQLTDVSGIRVVSSKGISDVEDKVKTIEQNYHVIQKEDYMHNDKAGYRSVHLLVKDQQSGLVSEIQIRTQNQDKWATYAHDRVYKMPDDVLVKLDQHRGEVNAYTKAMSNYYYDLDSGKTGGIKPPCPEIVHEVIGCL